MEAILVLLILAGLVASHVGAYRIGFALGSRSRRASGQDRDTVL